MKAMALNATERYAARRAGLGAERELERIDRYLKIARWAERRYSRGGRLVIKVGGVWSRYSMIEDLAFRAYVSQDLSVPPRA